MKIGDVHLGFCTNIYTGGDWEQIRGQCLEHIPIVKAGVSPDAELGFGLWLPAHAVAGMAADADSFKQALKDRGIYIFTVNAFPYDKFHSGIVKEKVYFPDWSSARRVAYTCEMADLLAFVLPSGVAGSISTVPVTYGKTCPSDAQKNILKTAAHFQKIESTTGRFIQLALEPEPDCYLESIDECLAFFDDLHRMDRDLTQRYLGVCVDTCHLAVGFESPAAGIERLAEAGINIGKIQLSSALVYTNDAGNKPEVISNFDDGRFLHQTRINQNGRITSYGDLPEASHKMTAGEWRIHYHVPLHYVGDGHRLGTTIASLDQHFFNTAAQVCRHFEIETYTFTLLPGQKMDIDQSIIREFEFALSAMGSMGP
ncbi:MAG: metabolite traffic protein EboE [Desulfobacteraceae bacterium]|nr:metabolite traffic protein EboE [Desulfobacteraceae bacterium]